MGLCLITVHTLTANMEPRLADARLTLSLLTLPKTQKLLFLTAASEPSSRGTPAGETLGDGDYNAGKSPEWPQTIQPETLAGTADACCSCRCTGTRKHR